MISTMLSNSTVRKRAAGRSGRVALALAGLAALPAQAGTWDHGHGDATNSGYADVRTKAALRPDVLVGGIGTYAPGAGPVIGPGGNVVLGSEQGVLRALKPGGAIAWVRALGSGNAIVASPVVDVDGSIYVIGERTFVDHHASGDVRRTDSTVFRYSASGDLIWESPLPLRYNNTVAANRGATSASPTIWRQGGNAAVLVSAAYQVLGGAQEFRLLALSPAYGSVLRDQLVTFRPVGAVTGNSGGIWSTVGCILTFCWYPKLIPGFSVHGIEVLAADRLPDDISPPMAGMALFAYPGAGAPFIVLNDPWQATVGFVYRPQSGFAEMFRKIDPKRAYATTPMVLPDGHSVTGIDDPAGGRLSFFRPNGNALPDVPLVNDVFATPARTRDQRIVTVAKFGYLRVVQNGTVLPFIALNSETIAPVAVSQSHIFVSTAGAFLTFDATTLAEVGRVDWLGGGRSSPAIGATGRVYALASNVLFGWPGPPPCSTVLCGPTPPVVGRPGVLARGGAAVSSQRQ